LSRAAVLLFALSPIAAQAEGFTTVNLVSNQVPYSLVNRGIEKDLVPQAVQKQLSIIPYSPLQRGLLTGKIKPGHVFGPGDTRENNKFYQAENIARVNAMLETLKPLAEKHKATLTQLIINWTTRQPAMDCVLVGARHQVRRRPEIGAQHEEVAVGEVDDVHDPEDQRQPRGDQRQDHAVHEAVHDLHEDLIEGDHALTLPGTGG